MLSQSRFTQQTKQLLQSLDQISNQIINYHFQSPAPLRQYKMKRHLLQLYNFVYENCTSKPNYQQKMFQAFKSSLIKHLIKYMDILNDSLKNNKVIFNYNLIWKSYTAYLTLLSNRIFTYLNRYYVPANDHQSLTKVGMNVFMKTFLAENNIRIFIGPYIKQLQKMRRNKIINNSQLLYFSQSFAILDNSQLFPILKESFMNQTQRYYKQVFEQNVNSQPASYINLINNLKYFQSILIKQCICFSPQQILKVNQLFNKQLVRKYTHILLTQPYGFSYMLRRNQVNNLKIVCKVYQQMEGFIDLRKFLIDFIVQQGNVFLYEKSKQQSTIQFINAFCQFNKNYYGLITQSFTKQSQMLQTLNTALQKLLLKYDRITQDLYKITRSSIDEGNFDQISQKLRLIFEKLSYKDEYLNLYRNSLQKKIISGTFIYMLQKKFIQAMDKINASQITSTLNKILQDQIQSSSKIAEILPQISHKNQFNIKVLGLHFWQKKFEDQLTLNLKLVYPLEQFWSKFENKYCEHFPKRKLLILPYQTKLILNVISTKKSFTIKCNLLQACIILYITQYTRDFISKKPSQDTIINQLQIEKATLQKFIEQFPTLILKTNLQEYQFNFNFDTYDSIVDLDSKVQEQKKITKHLKQDRDIIIQCHIVKLLKKKKQLMFQELVLDVVNAVKLFKPTPIAIRSAIDHLKKKEMLEEIQHGKITYKQ